MKQVKKVICEYCGREISKSNYSKHIRSHENGNYDRYIEQHNKSQHLEHDDLICKYCGKECKNKSSLVQHEIRCKLNPNKINTSNSWGNRNRSAWNKGLTKDTDNRVLSQSISLKKTLNKDERNINIGGFRERSAKKCKFGTYKGFYCDSSWELAFVIYCLDNNINIKRNTKYFEYEYENKLHKYYPDFIIDDKIFYEIKGIYSKADYFKHKVVDNLKIIDKHNINKYLNYVINKYGKNFDTLYDSNFPSWMDLKNKDKQYNFNTEI